MITLLDQGNCSVSPSEAFKLQYLSEVIFKYVLFSLCLRVTQRMSLRVSLAWKSFNQLVSQLWNEENSLLGFRQPMDKGVSRVSKALKIIMGNGSLDFAGLWNINISSIQVLISACWLWLLPYCYWRGTAHHIPCFEWFLSILHRCPSLYSRFVFENLLELHKTDFGAS